MPEPVYGTGERVVNVVDSYRCVNACLSNSGGPISLIPFPSRGYVLKVVIPVKTGIQFYIIRHDSWIPTYVGMTKRLKKGTYDTSHPLWEGKINKKEGQSPS
jgi:hypothetical protein